MENTSSPLAAGAYRQNRVSDMMEKANVATTNQIGANWFATSAHAFHRPASPMTDIAARPDANMKTRAPTSVRRRGSDAEGSGIRD